MKKKISNYLNLLFFLLQLLVTVGFVFKKKYNYIFNPGISSLFYLSILLLERFTPFKLKNYVRLLLIITLSSHNIFGEYFNAYNKLAFFDNALHLFGTFSFAIFTFNLLSAAIRISASRPKLLTLILVVLLGIGVGTIFELLEFSLDVFSTEHNQRGLKDTDLDLLYDFIGSLMAGLFLVITDPIKGEK